MSPRPKLSILGSLNMDISVTVAGLPVPGETVLGTGAVTAPGGKGANQALAAARLGAGAAMAGCTGDDSFGRAARSALAAGGVDTSGVRAVAGAPTGVALITVDPAGENMIVVAPGANAQAGQPEVAAALAGSPDLLLVSAEIPPGALAAALDAARAAGLACLLNLAPAPPGAASLLAGGVSWLVVNQTEAAAVLGQPAAGLDAAAAARSLHALGAQRAVVTAGRHGAVLHGPAGTLAVPAPAVSSVDSVGAGDAFVAALAVAAAAGAGDDEAVRLACAAGAAATTRRGAQAALPSPADILAATGITWPLAPS